MDKNVEQLLSSKVGFFKKLFNSVYSVDTVKSAFEKGKSIVKVDLDSLKVNYDNVNSKLSVLTKDKNKVDLELKAKKSLNDDLGKQISRLSELNNKLEQEKKDLTKKVNSLTTSNTLLKQDLKDSDKAGDIKALEQKLKDQESKFAKEKSKVLKECTDEFMKTINKQDKEISRITKIVEKSPKSKPKKESHKTNGKVNGQPAFTCEQVVKIRKEYKEGKNTTQLASEYNVNRSTIDRMVQGKTYKKCK